MPSAYPLTIVVAAWGGEFCTRFRGAPLASHADALRYLIAATDPAPDAAPDIRYLLYTDDNALADEITARTGVVVERVPLNMDGTRYKTLLGCHRDALKRSEGRVVILLNADNVVSRETFAAVMTHMNAGKRLVMCASTRTDTHPPDASGPPADPPPDASGPALAAWIADHMHMVTRELIWGEGRSAHPSLLYFVSPASTIIRGWHLHPLAILADFPNGFEVSRSIDWDLGENIGGPWDEYVHVVTSSKELVVAEVSAHDKWPEVERNEKNRRVMDVPGVVRWATATGGTTAFHRWLFGHRVVLVGDGTSDSDTEVAASIEGLVDEALARMEADRAAVKR